MLTFLVSAHLGSPGKRAVKWVRLCACDLLLFVQLLILIVRHECVVSAGGLLPCTVDAVRDLLGDALCWCVGLLSAYCSGFSEKQHDGQHEKTWPYSQASELTLLVTAVL